MSPKDRTGWRFQPSVPDLQQHFGENRL